MTRFECPPDIQSHAGAWRPGHQGEREVMRPDLYSGRLPFVIAFGRQPHRLRHRLLPAQIISDRAAGEAERFGGAVEREAMAFHPAAKAGRRHRLARLLVRPAAKLRGAEVDAADLPFDSPAIVGDIWEIVGAQQWRELRMRGDNWREVDLGGMPVIPFDEEAGRARGLDAGQLADARVTDI